MIYQVLNDRKGPHRPDLASCRDCAHMKAAVSWWCTSEPANAEGRRIPGHRNCPHWEPCETLRERSARLAHRSWWERLFEIDPHGEGMVVDPIPASVKAGEK